MGEQRERRLIAEWRQARYPNDQHIMGCPLGSADPDQVAKVGLTQALKAARPWRLEADCVVIRPGRLIVAEAKIFRPRDGVGDLLCYRPLLARTPELAQYQDVPVDLVLVIPQTTAVIQEMCDQHGIRVDAFCPDWIAAYVQDHNKYWTAEYQSARADRNAVRKALGVE